MFLFHFNIDFLGSDFIRGAFQRPRFQNLFRRACMFPDTWSHSTHGPMLPHNIANATNVLQTDY